MSRKLILASSFALGIAAMSGCASRNAGVVTTPEMQRCADLADTVSKYVSEDALPPAHLVGNPLLPRVPVALSPSDSVYVEFVVRPDGLADTSSILITGANDPEFARSVTAFAVQSRFMPAQSQGCTMLSKYSLVVKSRAPGVR